MTNVSVMFDKRHIKGSPFIFTTVHQYAASPRKGTVPLPPPPERPSNGSRMGAGAFVTLVATEEFALGALVLGDSLRRVGSRYPLVAMLTDSVGPATEATLEHAGLLVRRVDTVGNPYAAFKATLEERAWEQVYTKIQAWTLEEFDRVVFMDADQLVLRNIDDLLERSMRYDLAAVPDVAPPIFFNSGMMVLRPSLEVVGDMLEKMHALPSYDDGDQGFLNAYFQQAWDRLPYVYNFVKSKTGNPEAFYWLLDHQWWNVRVVHMVGVKPWRCTSRRDCGGFPERVVPRLWALWWDRLHLMCGSDSESGPNPLYVDSDGSTGEGVSAAASRPGSGGRFARAAPGLGHPTLECHSPLDAHGGLNR